MRVLVRLQARVLAGFVLFLVMNTAYSDNVYSDKGYSDNLPKPPGAKSEVIKVMTLNIGHARADGRSQLWQTVTQARNHLWRIINVLKREKPHIAAFQEIDRNSFWNGRFDHTEFVARNADYPFFFTGSHASGDHLDYGTALVARVSLEQQTSVSFPRPFVRPRKGFVLSTFNWPGREEINVDLVSVHFDAFTDRKRKKEAHKLIKTLENRSNPRIVMGDLNTEYIDNAALIPMLEEKLGLYTWRPYDSAVTFPRFQKRFDWVLVSPVIEIISQQVLSDPLSDHRAIIAELRLTGG